MRRARLLVVSGKFPRGRQGWVRFDGVVYTFSDDRFESRYVEIQRTDFAYM